MHKTNWSLGSMINGRWGRRLLLCLALTLGGNDLAQAQVVAPTDNTTGPALGFYEWGLQDNNNKSQSRSAWMAISLNRTTLYTEDFLPTDSWSGLEGNSYIFNAAAQYLRQNPGSYYVLTVGLLPGSGATPLSGTSLANGAAGTYNSYFAALATNLVTAGIANRTIIRLGHEFNGGWYAWKVTSDADAVNYANYWKQVVPAVHAVSGASGIKFCWCGAILWDSYNVADAYPGNAYVDYVGVDNYDSCYASNTYPYPSGDSAADMLQRQKNAWAANNGTANNGMQWWANLANTNSKPFCIPEWGTWGIDSSGRGGGDDTYYIQQMYNFIQTTSNNVAFSIYFDVWADGNHQLCQAPSVGTTAFPNSWSSFQQLFSVPPYTTNNDIGTTGVAGGCTPYAVTGAGTGFLAGGTLDNFHFASQPISGNTLCLAQVTSTSVSSGQAGLMIRQSAAPSDPYAALYVSNGNLIFQSRATAGAAAMQNYVVGSISTPVWIKLLRTANVISGFQSTDGLNWTFAGSQTVTMNTSAYAGAAVSSGSTTVLNTVGLAQVNNPDVAADIYNTSTAKETSTTPAISSALFVGSSSSSVSKVGTWNVSGTQANLYGGTMLTCYTPTSSASLTFTPPIATAGQYDVYFTAPGNYQDGDQTPISVTSADGTFTGTFNEQGNDGLWVYLGTFNFAAGTTGNFKMTNITPGGYGYVSADGLMLVPVPVAALAPPAGLATTPGNSQVGLTWTAVSGASAYNVKRSTTSGGPYTTLSNPSTASYTDTTAVNGTTYYYVVSALASAGGESVNSTQASATPSGGTLPAGWADLDIGGPSPAGSASYASTGGVYSVNGGGSNIYYATDQFNYAYKSATGDNTMIARVTGLTYTSSTAKAALMFRDSTVSNAKYVLLDVKPGSNGIEFYSRETAGGSATWVAGATPGVTLSSTTPIWIKLAKSGTTYSAYYSTSISTPTSWTSIGTVTVSLSNSTYLAGLGVCSVNNGTLATGTFDNISIAQPVPGSVSSVVQGTTTSSTMAISWSAASGATSYNVGYQTSGGPWQEVSTTNLNATLTGLTSGVWYWIEVQGVNSAGAGPWTGVYSFQTP